MPRAAALRDVQAVRPGRGRGNVPAGTPGQRNTSSASTPFAQSVAWSASASAVVNRTPVSTPAGTRWRHLDPPPAVADPAQFTIQTSTQSERAFEGHVGYHAPH